MEEILIPTQALVGVLGKFDRGWTERPVYGKIRYMTSDSTKRKFRTKKYVETYSNPRSKQSTLFQNPRFEFC